MSGNSKQQPQQEPMQKRPPATPSSDLGLDAWIITREEALEMAAKGATQEPAEGYRWLNRAPRPEAVSEAVDVNRHYFEAEQSERLAEARREIAALGVQEKESADRAEAEAEKWRSEARRLKALLGAPALASVASNSSDPEMVRAAEVAHSVVGDAIRNAKAVEGGVPIEAIRQDVADALAVAVRREMEAKLS